MTLEVGRGGILLTYFPTFVPELKNDKIPQSHMWVRGRRGLAKFGIRKGLLMCGDHLKAQFVWAPCLYISSLLFIYMISFIEKAVRIMPKWWRIKSTRKPNHPQQCLIDRFRPFSDDLTGNICWNNMAVTSIFVNRNISGVTAEFLRFCGKKITRKQQITVDVCMAWALFNATFQQPLKAIYCRKKLMIGHREIVVKQ